MIAVDWGTSSLRVYRLDAGGAVIAQRRADLGIAACQGQFAATLLAQIEGWDDPCIVLSGMVGSRQGWMEVPYVDCPADAATLAAGVVSLQPPELPGRTLWFVPGVADRSNSQTPDVMRGEEAQICALIEALNHGSHMICLPGTHSKWVTVNQGRIDGISTAMTGEVYAVMRQHSLLGRSMNQEETRFDAFAFDAGLRRSGMAGGLLHHLFGVRTAALFDQLSASELPSYLSGLLIGHEIRASDLFQRVPRPVQVHLIGSDRLLSAYAHALVSLGVGVQRHSEQLAATGIHRIARQRGLID
ncbi:2-dehydro-3-deoxygalactonokinase [Pseudoxanthomonas wuyuanensis]|uniref:2-keto-3-deoxygalactonate kinase n=1 Tax=Pseudoxanthomonas wuyuanensis TaxID=1073196 RepID=A0A286DAX2_9GAMM|nr:2-dehydro-3-deoxygalactonokinase [Pseudoxanthomonas wuyuanensis]KAF1721825.1 MFS transporter [Pseudoxanthomonas wuyuanensis]SOD55783.1 2-keto-3-deoxygalactonate kinase [Pseudoxanthomonas wuyuanensis]